MLDATTGQNGLVQAQQFTEAVDLTGVVLTKLDGSAKGGIALAIQSTLGIPIKLVGLGETGRGPDRLRPRRVHRRALRRATDHARSGLMFTLIRLDLPPRQGRGRHGQARREDRATAPGRLFGYRRIVVFGAGVAVGLLVAPVTGVEARARLRRALEERRPAAATWPSASASSCRTRPAPGTCPSRWWRWSGARPCSGARCPTRPAGPTSSAPPPPCAGVADVHNQVVVTNGSGTD